MKQFFLNSFRDVDEILRGDRTRPQAMLESSLDVRSRRLSVTIVLLCMLYGVCMGTFSLLKEPAATVNDPNGPYWQVLASVVKTPALFFLTLIVTLPSLYVFNALVGSRLKLINLIRLLVSSLAVNAAVLASLGPIIAFFSLSTSSHAFIVLLNVAAFAVAGSLGLAFLLQTMHRLTPPEPRRRVRGLPEHMELKEADFAAVEGETPSATPPSEIVPTALDMPGDQVLGAHTRTVFQIWIVLFALVGAQMSWVLRPFIGSPNLPFEWFRHRQSNFFAAVLKALAELVFGTK